MRLSKNFYRALAATVLTLSTTLSIFTTSGSASVLDLLPGGIGTPGYYGVTFEERQPGYGEHVSVITSNIPPAQRVNNVGGTFLCTSMDDPTCARGSGVSAQLILPPCATADDRMCVEGLSIGTGTGGLEKATLDHQIDAPTTPADPITSLPKGGAPSLWNTATVANKAGTKTYGVVARVSYFQNRENIGVTGKRNNPITLTSMRVSVFPVIVTSGRYYPVEGYASVNSDGANTYGIRPKGNDYDNLENCAWLETGSCGKYTDFADNTRVSLSLRMGSEMTGWLYGRMKDVSVNVTPLDKKFNTITIEGAPVAAPGAYGFIKKSELTNYLEINSKTKISYGDYGYKEMMNSPGSVVSGFDPVGNFDSFLTYEPILKTIPGSRAQWVISSGASANGYTATGQSSCFSDKTKLLGIVTTNALIYSPSAPEFKDGTLNYKVAGVHFTEDGTTLTRGTYDLAIRSETARCVYGFTDAPFQASISVIGADGNEQTIATESIREDAKREWLFLSAQNFTFSSPTIRVKLTQEKKLTAPNSSTTTTSSKVTTTVTSKPAAKPSTITCVKGKFTSKISGTNPKCPAGYKKK